MVQEITAVGLNSTVPETPSEHPSDLILEQTLQCYAQQEIKNNTVGYYWSIPDDKDEFKTWLFFPHSQLQNISESGVKVSGKWKGFVVTQIVYDPQHVITYNFWLNGRLYVDYEFDQIMKLFNPQLQSTQSTQHFKFLMKQYLDFLVEFKPIPVIAEEKHLGFFDKWYLPDKYYIRVHKGIMENTRDCIAQMFTKPFTETQAIHAFQQQYEATTIPYKDYIFGWAIMQSFFFPLFPKTDLIPFLFLWGSGDMGISSIGKAVTARWWGHLGKDETGKQMEVLNSGITDANIKEYLASINLGYVIDDIHQNWGDNILGLLKTYLTNFTSWTLKNQQSEQKTNIGFKASPFFTGNEVPKALLDPQMLTRGLVLIINQKATAQDASNYRKVMETIPTGLIGWYIYQKTKDWTQETLFSLFSASTIKDLFTECKDEKARANSIYRLFQIAKQLCQDWFHITLNHSELPVLLQQTRTLGNIELTTNMLLQIQYGNVTDPMNSKIINETVKFDCNYSWIKNPIYPHKRNGVEGIIYNGNNLKDLEAYLQIQRKEGRSMKQFAQIAKNYFPDAEFVEDTLSKKDPFQDKTIAFRLSIFIPQKNIDDKIGIKPDVIKDAIVAKPKVESYFTPELLPGLAKVKDYFNNHLKMDLEFADIFEAIPSDAVANRVQTQQILDILYHNKYIYKPDKPFYRTDIKLE